jgi:hypothetical protein
MGFSILFDAVGSQDGTCTEGVESSCGIVERRVDRGWRMSERETVTMSVLKSWWSL